MAIRQWGLLAAAMALMAFAYPASACSVAPFNETWAIFGSTAWTGTDAGCRLESSVIEQGSLVGTAIAHHRRYDPASPYRLSFRVALPGNASLGILKNASIARGVARAVPVGGPYEARMFAIVLSGNVAGTKARLGFFAACGSQSGGLCVTSSADLDYSSFPLRITLELAMGQGAAGSLRYWLGENTSGAPTGSIENLDNIRWSGIERVSIGLSDVSPQMAPALAGQPLVFDQISSSERSEFWSDFDSSDAGDVIPNAVPIAASMQIQGTLCGGSNALPQIAGGSTSLRGPVAIHAVPATVNVRQVSVTSPTTELAVFLCPLDGGPASPCTSAGKSGAGYSLLVAPSLSERRVVVGAVGANPSNCPSYTMNVVGTLGDQSP